MGDSNDLTAPDNQLAVTNSQITATLLAGTYITENTLQDDGELDGISCTGTYQDCNGNPHTVAGNPDTLLDCVDIKAVTTCPLPSSSITTTERAALIEFIRGKKADGTPRQHMGAILNAKPVIVNYGTEKRIFTATNEGFLHAINTEDGQEKWAFMPRALLKNIKTLYENQPTDQPVYGIDGSLTLWNYDANSDGTIDASAGDKRILFFGLRRGGKAYYALDITSADNPVLLWKKENIVDIEEGPLDTLGETWSKPTLATMRIGSNTSNEVRTVVVFGAGYDAAKDVETVNARTADKLGRDVFIVDALTGEIHWSLQRDLYQNSETSNPIKHSIPGDIRVMDMDRNGTLDRLYFADTGGNLWRVDMDADLRDADVSLYDYKDAKLTKIAELGDNGDNGTDTRKFFYEPDVALIGHNGQVHMTIALGSGYRTHPLNTNSNDRFYVIVDPNVYQEPPANFVAIKNSDLINARATLGDTGGFATTHDNLLNGNHKGWYYDFDNTGEKVLAPAVTFLNKV
ncbi:MAG: pilus assembly protein, partial [Thiothrix sp.]